MVFSNALAFFLCSRCQVGTFVPLIVFCFICNVVFIHEVIVYIAPFHFNYSPDHESIFLCSAYCLSKTVASFHILYRLFEVEILLYSIFFEPHKILQLWSALSSFFMYIQYILKWGNFQVTVISVELKHTFVLLLVHSCNFINLYLRGTMCMGSA